MKNLLFLVLSASLVLTFLSCKKDNNGPMTTQTEDLKPFTGVATHSFIDVNIYYGTEQTVELTGPENLLEKVILSVEKGRLNIKMKNGTYTSNKNIVADITIPMLDFVAITGSGDVWIDKFEGLNNLELNITGSGDIESSTLAIQEQLDVEITGSGEITLQGSASSSTIEIRGSGDYQAYGMATNTCEVEIRGSGNVETQVDQTLKVSISGSGDVHYKGSPSVNVDISGSGNVVDKN